MKPAVAYVYNAEVLAVKDADTLQLRVDQGFGNRKDFGARLIGINCAEHGTELGDAATAYVRGLLPVGTPIVVASTKVEKQIGPDKYNRYDVVVWRSGTDESLNDELIRTGHAAVWNGRGPRPTPTGAV